MQVRGSVGMDWRDGEDGLDVKMNGGIDGRGRNGK